MKVCFIKLIFNRKELQKGSIVAISVAILKKVGKWTLKNISISIFTNLNNILQL